LKPDLTGLFTHGDFVTDIPKGFTAIGQHQLGDGFTAYSAIARGNKLGVQFHPEVFDDTPEGYQLFRNFLFDVARLSPDESFQGRRLEELITGKRQAIARQVGKREVIAFVSGGVDSSVAATLAAAVIPAGQFHAFYIDNGFMRDEDDLVIEALNATGMQVQKIDATGDFEQATAEIDDKIQGPLTETSDPETKRKIIGKAFIDTQNRILAQLKLKEALLLQGTNAADRIESGHSTGDAHTMTIKTHHNQVREVQELKARGLLIEPLDDLFKDEVRELGRELGLPEELVERQPFPGPGLAIRIIAAAKAQPQLPVSDEQTAIQLFLDQHAYAGKQQLSAHLLPVRSVGVGGDERSHISVVAIEGASVETMDLAALARDLPAHFRGVVNRVIYALGPESLSKSSVTKTLLTADVRHQLRQADRLVFEAMRSSGLLSEIKQFPVVLLPLSFGSTGQRSIVLRPVTTSTFMTVQAMLPGRDYPAKFIESIASRILSQVPGISQVFLDLTNKPPATTEWE
jgi:GMP synthase (glutamine-hydrolysing)